MSWLCLLLLSALAQEPVPTAVTQDAEAIAVARAALEQASTAQARARALQALGVRLTEAGDPVQALEVHARSVKLHRSVFGADAPETVQAQVDQLMAVRAAEGAEAALGPAQALLERQRRLHGAQSWEVALALFATSEILEDLDQLEQAAADRLAMAAISETQPPERSGRLAEHLNAAGRLLQALDRFDDAEAAYRRALAAPNHNRNGEAVTLANLGVLLADQGQHEEAERVLDQAVAIQVALHGKDAHEVAQTRARRALTRYRAGALVEAQADSEAALAVLIAYFGEESVRVANARAVLGHIAQERGDRALARQSYEQARTVLSRLEGRALRDAATPITSLALMAMSDGDVELALALLDEVQEIQSRSGASALDRLATEANRGALQVYLGELDEAASAFTTGLELLDEAGLTASEHRATMLDDLAVVRRKQGDLPAAIALGEQALELRIELLGPDHPAVAHSHYNLGMFAYRARELEQAHDHFVQSLSILEGIAEASHVDVLECLAILAQLETSMGRPERALAHLERLFHGREALFLQNMAFGSARQKLLFVQSYSNGIQQLVTLCTQRLDTPACRELAAEAILGHKGRVLEVEHDSLARVRDNDEATPLLEELQAAWAAWDRLQRDEASTAEARAEARKTVESLQDQLSRLAAGMAPPSPSVTVERVSAQLPAGTALVEYLRYPAAPMWEDHYSAMVLDQSGVRALVDLGPADIIDAHVLGLRKDLRRLVGADPRRPAALYELLLAPLASQLGDVQHLVLSPDGALSLLPFDLLQDDSGTLLHERFVLSSLTSGRDLLRLATTPPPGGAPRVVVDPAFADPDLERLPGTAVEGKHVARQLRRAQLLTGEDATVAAVSAPPAPVVLHIATHGRFATAEDAQSGSAMVRSGLELAGEDPFLSAAELSTLDLRGTELVVLSACETGLGEVLAGEGVAGLRRGLQLAGSRSQVLSLWRVDDRATQLLMSVFYRHLLRGVGRAEALRRAKAHLRTTKGYGHPRYWAAFMLSGDWGPLPQPLFRP